MFKGASNFNQEIRTWDVTGMFNSTNTHPYPTLQMFNGATAFQYTPITNPELVFWANWESYELTASDLPWSDEDVTFEPHPNTVALWNNL